jgi:hypothetical protein
MMLEALAQQQARPGTRDDDAARRRARQQRYKGIEFGREAREKVFIPQGGREQNISSLLSLK